MKSNRPSLRASALALALCAGALVMSVAPASAAVSHPQATIHPVVHAAVAPKVAENGISMHYYPGLFETVARNRGMALRHDVDGYTSRQNCWELGRVITARLYNPSAGRWGKWLRLQVLDCSARRDVAHHRAIGLILEVDYKTAANAGFVYRGWTQAEVGQ